MIDSARYHNHSSGNQIGGHGMDHSHTPSSPTSHSHSPNSHHSFSPGGNNLPSYQQHQQMQQQRSMVKSDSSQSISSPPSPLLTSSAPSTPLSESGIVSNNNNNNSNQQMQHGQQNNNGINGGPPSSKPGFQTCSHANHELWWSTSPELPVSEFYTRSYKCKRCYIRQQTESKKTRQSPIGNNGHIGGGNNHSPPHGYSHQSQQHHQQHHQHQNPYSNQNNSNNNPNNNNNVNNCNINGSGFHLNSNTSNNNNNNNNPNNNHNNNHNNNNNNNSPNNNNNHHNNNNNNGNNSNINSNIDNAINQTFSQNSILSSLANLSSSYPYNGNNVKNGGGSNQQQQQQQQQQYERKQSKYLAKKHMKHQEEAQLNGIGSGYDNSSISGGSEDEHNYPINPINYIDQVINSSGKFNSGGGGMNKGIGSHHHHNNNNSGSPKSDNESDEKKIESYHYMFQNLHPMIDRDPNSQGYIDSYLSGRLEQSQYFTTFRIKGNLGSVAGNGNGANSKIGGFITEVIVGGKTFRGVVFEDLKSSNQSNHSQNFSPNQSGTNLNNSNNIPTSKKIKDKNVSSSSSSSFLPTIGSTTSTNNQLSNGYNSNVQTSNELEALLILGKQVKNDEESKKRKKPYNSDTEDQPSYALKTNLFK
ncbi:hypothetical protein RB653_008361 [Dictyostelium firmibasis]|uniref:Uncharacterized protein n=1 Tax=Dictyostelium firmibasis TaxID=79012 RepID=A0AAN7UCH5_9MYCE